MLLDYLSIWVFNRDLALCGCVLLIRIQHLFIVHTVSHFEHLMPQNVFFEASFMAFLYVEISCICVWHHLQQCEASHQKSPRTAAYGVCCHAQRGDAAAAGVSTHPHT